MSWEKKRESGESVSMGWCRLQMGCGVGGCWLIWRPVAVILNPGRLKMGIIPQMPARLLWVRVGGFDEGRWGFWWDVDGVGIVQIWFDLGVGLGVKSRNILG